MKILVNGNTQELKQEQINIKDLLVHNDVKMIDMVSVQLNGEFINKADFTNIHVKENDTVDFLFFMGGGK